MAWNPRKTFRLGKGVRLTLSRNGLGWGVGRRGLFSLGRGADGRRRASLGGGLFRQDFHWGKKSGQKANSGCGCGCLGLVAFVLLASVIVGAIRGGDSKAQGASSSPANAAPTDPPAVSADEPSPVAGIQALLGGPSAGVIDALGKPVWTSDDKNSASWLIGGWDVALENQGGKVAKMIVGAVPDQAKHWSVSQAAQAFGFTEANGWTIAAEQATAPVVRSVALTHPQRGICHLHATVVQGQLTVLNFRAPGVPR